MGASDSDGDALSKQRLRKSHRLTRSEDFRRCYRQGRRVRGRSIALHVVANDLAQPRLGITASRKVGGAVVRNQLKRRTREFYRTWSQRQDLPNLDIVVHFYPRQPPVSANDLYTELEGLLQRLLEH